MKLKLSHKLFLSHILVVIVGLCVIVLATAFATPANFSERIHQRGMMLRMGQSMHGTRITELETAINESLRETLNTVLLWAGLAAIVAAAGVSWTISQQVVNPIRALADLSQRIARGHYDERLKTQREDEIGELTRSFNQMAAALAETETMRQRLIADVTHELKTPLASMRGYLEGLQDGMLPATPETFQVMHRETARMQRLVQDLQALSRAEAGQEHIEVHPCDIGRLIEAIIQRMKPQFSEHGTQLISLLPPFLPKVCADLERTEQVLINLLGNALQYTPAGGVVRVTAEARAADLEITVHDTGIGLVADDLEKVFQRFYRVDKSRSRAGGGSGIGLTISRHLVEAQGGELWAESAGLGQGCRFHFTLPLAGTTFTKTLHNQHTGNIEQQHPEDKSKTFQQEQ